MNQADVLKLGANKTNEEFSRNPNFQVNNINSCSWKYLSKFIIQINEYKNCSIS